MKPKHQILEPLWQQGKNFLKTKYPILGGAMSWISECNLVSAISNAGGFGVIACGSMTHNILEKELQATFNMTNKPFGVNIITLSPYIEDLIKVCIDYKVSHVVLAGGIPRQKNIDLIKKNNIKTIGFAPSLAMAKRMISSGIDALIIEGREAGGHIGHLSTSVLVQEILPHIAEQLPIFIAGGVARGEIIASYLLMGASGCQLGTKFVCAKESIAHQKFKDIFIRSPGRYATESIQIDESFKVIPVRAITNDASNKFLKFQQEIIDKYQKGEIQKEEAQLDIERYWVGALRNAVINGNINEGSLMAGQCVGMISKEQTALQIIEELVSQASDLLEKKLKILQD